MKKLQAQKNANERLNQSRGSGALSSRSIIIIKNKRVRLTNEQKLTVCHYNEAHPNLSYEEISRYMQETFRVKPSRSVTYAALSVYKKLSALPSDQFRKVSEKKAKFPKLEDELRKFIYDTARDNITINYLSILARTEILIRFNPELLERKEKPEFSRGWVQKFMAREGIRVRLMNSEAESVEIHEPSIQEQLRKIRDIIQHYELKDIYNMDETGLFYRSAPKKLLVQTCKLSFRCQS